MGGSDRRSGWSRPCPPVAPELRRRRPQQPGDRERERMHQPGQPCNLFAEADRAVRRPQAAKPPRHQSAGGIARGTRLSGGRRRRTGRRAGGGAAAAAGAEPPPRRGERRGASAGTARGQRAAQPYPGAAGAGQSRRQPPALSRPHAAASRRQPEPRRQPNPPQRVSPVPFVPPFPSFPRQPRSRLRRGLDNPRFKWQPTPGGGGLPTAPA